MIALPKAPQEVSPCHAANIKERAVWHEQFLNLLPQIRRHARYCFCHLDPDAREESVQSAVAYAWFGFARLVQLGRSELAYAAPLAKFGVARVRQGRILGTRANVQDISSTWSQRRNRVQIRQLHEPSGEWQEALLQDRRSSPAELAAMRIDFCDWLASLRPRHRRIAQFLARGEETWMAARRFRVSPARISQIRRELEASWLTFSGEATAESAAS
jgi:hypothetical protein